MSPCSARCRNNQWSFTGTATGRAAEEAQAKARQRLKAASGSIKASISTGQALLAQEHDARAAALVSLKGSITKSQQHIAKEADLFR